LVKEVERALKETAVDCPLLLNANMFPEEVEKYKGCIPPTLDNVGKGYIVRTRADASTNIARTGNYAGMYAAFESGAQIISTDYYKPDPRGGIDSGWTTYKVAFPNGEKGRKNPVNAVNVNVESRLED
jgi:hypothetical protein